MKRFLLAVTALVVAALIVGCGSPQGSPSPPRVAPRPATPTRTIPATPSQPACVVREPAGAGECVRQAVEAKGVTPAAIPESKSAGADPAPQGADISRWNGVPNPRSVSFLLIQTNDGGFANPLFWLQATEARNAHVPFGVYVFVEGGCGSCEANLSYQTAKGSGFTLGAWADAEIPTAYSVTCTVVSDLHAHFHIVGVYSSPGIYAGGHCEGYLWPAEWGGGQAYSFAGYPRSAVKVRQWSGSGTLAGFTGPVDRDEALGLLALAHPAPTHAQTVARWHRELDVHYRLRVQLRDLEAKHDCRNPPDLKTRPDTDAYRRACYAHWVPQGRVENQQIAAFHRLGVY